MGIPVTNFTKLKREACKASIMIEGLTGKGKSGLALMIAYGLVGGFKELPEGADKATNIWDKIFAIDTATRLLQDSADNEPLQNSSRHRLRHF